MAQAIASQMSYTSFFHIPCIFLYAQTSLTAMRSRQHILRTRVACEKRAEMDLFLLGLSIVLMVLSAPIAITIAIGALLSCIAPIALGVGIDPLHLGLIIVLDLTRRCNHAGLPNFLRA